MNRIVIVIIVFLGTSLASAVALWLIEGDGAIETGDSVRRYRQVARKLTHPSISSSRRLVWMGDSTMITAKGIAGFPGRINRSLAGRATATNVFYPGFDFYHHYYLMGPVLDIDPSLIVIPIHLRLFDSEIGEARNDLASFLPARDLIRASILPLHARQLSIPKLLLFRLLRFEIIEKAYLFSVGTQLDFHEASIWNRLGQELPRESAKSSEERVIRQYEVFLHGRSPMLRMLAATLAMAERKGVRVLVIVSPIPWERLASDGIYDPVRSVRRISILRDTVRSNGAEFLDLHRSLMNDGFRDSLGHYSEAGTKFMQYRLQPIIEDLLFEPKKSVDSAPSF